MNTHCRIVNARMKKKHWNHGQSFGLEYDTVFGALRGVGAVVWSRSTGRIIHVPQMLNKIMAMREAELRATPSHYNDFTVDQDSIS